MNAAKENMTGRKTKKLLVSFIAVLALLSGCVGCKKETPREAVDKAFEKTFSASSPLENLLGISEIQKAIADKTPYSSGVTMTLQNLSGDMFGEYASLLSGIGFSVDSATNVAKEQLKSVIGISYGNNTYLTVNAFADASKLYLTAPQLLSGSLSLDLATLKEDLASDSFLGKTISSSLASSGIEIPDELNASIWNFFTTETKIDTTLPESITNAYDAMMKQIVTEEVKKDDVTLPSEVSAKKVYNMTISKDSYRDLVSATVQYFFDSFLDALSTESVNIADIDMPSAEEITAFVEELVNTLGDIVLTVAVNKDGYVCYLGSELNIQGITVTFSSTLSGEKSPMEDVQAKLSANIMGQRISLSASQKLDIENQSIAYNGKLTAGDFTAEFSAEGSYRNVEKGKKYHFDLDFFELNCPGILSFTLSGSSYTDVTACDIELPTGTEYELLKMSENAFTGLITEIVTKLQSDPLLSGLLEGLGL